MSKTLAAIMAASILALVASPAEARRSDPAPNVTQFCGDRVCPVFGEPAKESVKKVRKARRSGGGKITSRTPIRRAASAARADVSGAYSYGPTASQAPETPAAAGGAAFGGGSALVETARRYLGRGNPTRRGNLWCAAFMNLVLERTGRRGTGSDMASSFARYGTRISGPQVGAIAVMSRGRRGGHVGVVSGIDGQGNPIIISGNHGNRVAETRYPRGRIYAYVIP